MTLMEFLATAGPKDQIIVGGGGAGIEYWGIARHKGKEEYYTPEMAAKVRAIDREAKAKRKLVGR